MFRSFRRRKELMMTIPQPQLCPRAFEGVRRIGWHRALGVCTILALSCVTTAVCSAQNAASDEPANLTDALRGGLNERPIAALKATIALPTPEAPENAAAPHMQRDGVHYQPSGLGRGWILQPYEWEATALTHLPLYYEEPNLERLGYYYGYPCDGRVRRAMFCNITEYMATVHDDSPIKQCYFNLKCELDAYQPHNQILQPMVSAAHFFGRVAMVPYMVGACNPHCPVYELGADRPGSPVPYRKYYMPLSLKGAFYQGAAATGIGYIIP
jgi:hypothetical protein